MKMDPETDVARAWRLPVRRRSTVTSETESERSVPHGGELLNDGSRSGQGELMDSTEEIGFGLSATNLRSVSSDSGPEYVGRRTLPGASTTLMTVRTQPTDALLQKLREALTEGEKFAVCPQGAEDMVRLLHERVLEVETERGEAIVTAFYDSC